MFFFLFSYSQVEAKYTSKQLKACLHQRAKKLEILVDL